MWISSLILCLGNHLSVCRATVLVLFNNLLALPRLVSSCPGMCYIALMSAFSHFFSVPSAFLPLAFVTTSRLPFPSQWECSPRPTALFRRPLRWPPVSPFPFPFLFQCLALRTPSSLCPTASLVLCSLGSFCALLKNVLLRNALLKNERACSMLYQ